MGRHALSSHMLVWRMGSRESLGRVLDSESLPVIVFCCCCGIMGICCMGAGTACGDVMVGMSGDCGCGLVMACGPAFLTSSEPRIMVFAVPAPIWKGAFDGEKDSGGALRWIPF